HHRRGDLGRRRARDQAARRLLLVLRQRHGQLRADEAKRGRLRRVAVPPGRPVVLAVPEHHLPRHRLELLRRRRERPGALRQPGLRLVLHVGGRAVRRALRAPRGPHRQLRAQVRLHRLVLPVRRHVAERQRRVERERRRQLDVRFPPWWSWPLSVKVYLFFWIVFLLVVAGVVRELLS